MSSFFETYFTMCAEGSLILLIMLLLRVLLGRMPKKYICLLWVAVMLRLLCPYAAEGPVPAFWEVWLGTAETGGGAGSYQEADGESGRTLYGPEATPYGEDRDNRGQEADTPGEAAAVYGPGENRYEGEWETQEPGGAPYGEDREASGPDGASRGRESLSDRVLRQSGKAGMLKNAVVYLGLVWLAGAVVYAYLAVREYLRLKRGLETAVFVREWQGKPVKESDTIVTPMAFGIARPCIYMPAGFEEQVSKEEYALVLSHERNHLRRRDHLLKALSCLVFCVHWWNPLVRLGMRMQNEDVEKACDEAVLGQEKEDVRDLYARVLLQFAVQRSGLTAPVSFGESNTEKRVKNILNYRKKPFFLTAAAAVLAVIVGICLLTRPHSVQDKGQEDGMAHQEETTDGGVLPDGAGSDKAQEEENKQGEENKQSVEKERGEIDAPEMTGMSFLSYEAMQDAGREHWQRSMEENADAFAAGELYALDYYNISKYVIAQAVQHDEELSLELVYYTLSGWNVPRVYLSRVECNCAEGMLWVTKWVDIDIDVIKTADEAKKLDVFLYQYALGEEETLQGQGADIAWLARLTLEDKVIDRVLLSSNSEALRIMERLKHPVDALSFLMPVEGGKGEFHLWCEDLGVVVYTFADGTHVNYLMTRANGGSYWFPAGLAEEDVVQQWLATEGYVERVTAGQLRSADVLFDPARDAEGAQGEWVLLSEAGGDAALYGLSGGYAMALRVGEDVYPVRLMWTSPQMRLPELYRGDYDGDGEEEYAVKTHMRTGTGVSGDELCLIEVSGGERMLYVFSERNWIRQLLSRCTYTFDPEEKTVDFVADDTCCTLDLKRFYKDGYEFAGLSFGDIMEFAERDGQWYFEVLGGVNAADMATVWYEYGIEVTCPVYYNGAGGFLLGEMEARPVY